MKKIELPATKMEPEEELAILTADREVLLENVPLAKAIDIALAALQIAIDTHKPH